VPRLRRRTAPPGVCLFMIKSHTHVRLHHTHLSCSEPAQGAGPPVFFALRLRGPLLLEGVLLTLELVADLVGVFEFDVVRRFLVDSFLRASRASAPNFRIAKNATAIVAATAAMSFPFVSNQYDRLNMKSASTPTCVVKPAIGGDTTFVGLLFSSAGISSRRSS
jgi:hypothetical protein